MTSVGAWCEMMDNFLGELEKTFPNEPGVKKYKTSYELVRKANSRKCVESFMAACAPYSEKIMSKDEAFFLVEAEKVSFIKEMRIREHWEQDCTQATRDAIWQYVQTLYILGTTITALPADTLGMIESVAENMAGQMQQGNQDPQKMLSAMSGLFGMLEGKKN